MKSFLLAALLLVTSIPAQADLTIDTYEGLKGANNTDILDSYMNGMLSGIMAMNARQSLYCPPGDLVINRGNTLRIIDNQIVQTRENLKDKANEMPVSILLVAGLVQMFPCKEDAQ